MAEVVQETPPILTAQQMIERNIVPVKAEYLVQKVPATKHDAPPGLAADSGASTTATAAATGEPKQERGTDQSRSKSRKQMRKDFRAGRQAELCTNAALGRCTFGERCKFSHDLTAYVASKAADLPGKCPWTAVNAACPYGITCRYARSHRHDDELHRLLEAASPPGTTPEAAAPPAAATAAPARLEGEGARSADPAEGGAAGGPEGATGEDGIAPADASAQILALPLPASIERETNFLSKEVQGQLWKNRYDFSRADSILKSMELRISFKHQAKPLPGGGPGRGPAADGAGGRKEAGAQGNAQPSLAAAAPPATAVPDGGLKAVKEAPDTGAGEGGRAPKDQGLQEDLTGTATAASVDAASGGEGAPPPLKRQRVEGSDGDADAGVGCGGVEGAVAAVPQAPSAADSDTAMSDQPLSAAGPKGSDGDLVAALAAEQEQPCRSAQAEGVTEAEGGGGGRSAEAVREARDAHVEARVRPCERRRLDFRGKTYLAPLTTVGNLPFRRVCKTLGVDVTCGEMALATNLLQGQASEWALMKRHPCEDFFGVQVCGGYPDALARVGQLLGEQLEVDFVDINMGCPIDLVCDKNAGSALLRQPRRIEQILRATSAALGETPLTFKTRKGYNDGEDVAHTFLHKAGEWGAAAVTLHGRTRQQRYSRLADWEYIRSCSASCAAAGLQLIGNGDAFSYLDWNTQIEGSGGHLAALMVGRGALVKPWIFTEIKEQRHWDISASERLDLYRDFCAAGLEHWGSDGRGVETTRRFLLEWLSFTCRYVPVGLLEVLPQQMNHRPPAFRGRSQLETLLASDDPQDWVRISEMLLGPPPAPISFSAKHKSNSYAAPGASSELDMARG